MAESSNENYKVPIGLRPLLEAFVRETLRTQPIDLVSFSILSFNVLQKHRKPFQIDCRRYHTVVVFLCLNHHRVWFYLSVLFEIASGDPLSHGNEMLRVLPKPRILVWQEEFDRPGSSLITFKHTFLEEFVPLNCII